MQQRLNAGNAVGKLPCGGCAGIERDGVVLGQSMQAADMVCVGMGNENGGQVVRGQAQLAERSFDAPGGDPRIHQQMRCPIREQQTVALRPAGKCM